MLENKDFWTKGIWKYSVGQCEGLAFHFDEVQVTSDQVVIHILCKSEGSISFFLVIQCYLKVLFFCKTFTSYLPLVVKSFDGIHVIRHAMLETWLIFTVCSFLQETGWSGRSVTVRFCSSVFKLMSNDKMQGVLQAPQQTPAVRLNKGEMR